MIRSLLRSAPVALALAAFVAAARPAAAQVSDYEMMYGRTAEVALDTILEMPEMYQNKAVRTRGQLDLTPGSTQLVYSLRGTFGGRLIILPVQEAGMEWEQQARRWTGKDVEVTGAIGVGTTSAAISGGQQTVYMRMWGFLGPPEEKAKGAKSAQISLEELVTRPDKLDGKLVTVRGQFRGSNLFGDLPSKSRGRSGDWVIKDDLFAIWVTGKKPKGSGFEFDAGLRRDTGKWLQVTGRVSIRGAGIVSIEATDVTITKPPSLADAAPKPVVAPAPPPPPKPKRPPVVVFSLPVDGERDVPPSTVFRIQFSKDMDEASLKDRVILRYAGRPQPGDRELDAVRVTYDAGLRALQIDPGDLLRPGRVVEVMLLPGIVDIDGLPLETRPGFNPGQATDVLRWQTAPPGFSAGQ